MDQWEFIEHIEALYRRNVDTARAKNNDYSSQGDAFSNFRLCEVLGLCKTEVAILVRLLDKIGRIAHLINRRPAVCDETMHDTIMDAINYLAILDVYVTHQDELDKEIERLQGLDFMPRFDFSKSCDGVLSETACEDGGGI